MHWRQGANHTEEVLIIETASVIYSARVPIFSLPIDLRMHILVQSLTGGKDQLQKRNRN